MRPEDPWTAQFRASRRGRIVKRHIRKQAERNSNIVLPESGQLEPQISKDPSRLRLLVMEGVDALTGGIIPRFKPTTDIQAMQEKLTESKQGIFDASVVTLLGGSATALSALVTGSELVGEAGWALVGLTAVTSLAGYRLCKFRDNVRLYSGHIDTLQPSEESEMKPDAITPFPQIEHHAHILQDPAASLELKVDSRSWLQGLHNFTGQVLDRWRPSQGEATRPQGKPVIMEAPSRAIKHPKKD